MDPTVQSANKLASASLKFDITTDETHEASIRQAKELGVWDAISKLGGTAYCVAVNPKTGQVSKATKMGSHEVKDYKVAMASVN